jgi:hypothetical protein
MSTRLADDELLITRTFSSRASCVSKQASMKRREHFNERWKCQRWRHAIDSPRKLREGNLRGGINKGRVNAHANDVAPQKILYLVDFAAHAGMNSKRGAWAHMACRGSNPLHRRTPIHSALRRSTALPCARALTA